MFEKYVRFARRDEAWCSADIRRGYLFGYDEKCDRTIAQCWQNAWYFKGGIMYVSGKMYVQTWRLVPHPKLGYDSNQCAYKPYWEDVSRSKTAQRILYYIRTHPNYRFALYNQESGGNSLASESQPSRRLNKAALFSSK